MRHQRQIICILVVGIIWSFLPFFSLFPSLQQSAAECLVEEPLLAALHAAGSEVQETSINGWGQLANGNFTMERLNGMAVQAMAQLGMKEGQYTLSKTQDMRHSIVRAETIQNGVHAVVLAQTVQVLPSKLVEGYIVVNVEISNSSKKIAVWQQDIKNIIKEFGCLPHINTCLVGWLDGKLLEEEWGSRLENAFQAAKATTVDKLQYTNFASFTGYSPAIADYVEYGNKKVNVNMAMRYSPHDNRTHIIVGSPVITREY